MGDLDSFLAAVQEGDPLRVQALLKKRPGLARQQQNGATPLHYAALYDHRKIVKLLLDHGADRDARDDRCHATPVVWFRGKSTARISRDLCNGSSHVGLHDAASMGWIAQARALLRQDPAAVNKLFGFGTPIHYASLWGQPEVVQLLLDNDADPNARNRDGDTALAVALRQVHWGAKDTPVIDAPSRKRLQEACRKVVEVLRRGR